MFFKTPSRYSAGLDNCSYLVIVPAAVSYCFYCDRYGPRETERRDEFSIKGQIHCEFKFATFSSSQQRYSHMREPEEQHYSSILEQALKPAVILVSIS